jgi:hypothetical protein
MGTNDDDLHIGPPFSLDNQNTVAGMFKQASKPGYCDLSS